MRILLRPAYRNGGRPCAQTACRLPRRRGIKKEAGASGHIEIRVRGGGAEVCKRHYDAREVCRALAPDELQALRALFDEVRFDGLPPVKGEGFILGGDEQEIVRIDGRGGRRVCASDPDSLSRLETRSLKNLTPHERLDSLFERLAATGRFERR